MTTMLIFCGGMCVLLALAQSWNITRETHIYRMCAQLYQTDGCASQESFQHAFCSKTFGKSFEKVEKHRVKYKPRDETREDVTNSPMNRTFSSVRRKEREDRTSKSATLPEHERGLLIAPNSYEYGSALYRLDPSNFSVKPFLNLSIRAIVAVAFSSKYQTVFIGTKSEKNSKILAFTGKQQKLLRRNVIAIDIDVDEERDLLFCVTSDPQKGLYRMSLNGKVFRPVLQSSIKCITLDTRRKLIYGCSKRQIFSMSYSVKNQRVLSSQCAAESMTMDLTSDGFYYNCLHDVYHISPKTGARLVANLKRTPCSLVVHDNRIYASTHGFHDVYVISINTKKVLTKAIPFGLYCRLCRLY